jgi:hypothetical protein
MFAAIQVPHHLATKLRRKGAVPAPDGGETPPLLGELRRRLTVIFNMSLSTPSNPEISCFEESELHRVGAGLPRDRSVRVFVYTLRGVKPLLQRNGRLWNLRANITLLSHAFLLRFSLWAREAWVSEREVRGEGAPPTTT